ncbi:right-handed parallel beta-helix repeat-containing protein [Blastopirellula marina]|uniref:Pectate lyase n=1 Tax=Blastopirellula marina TaxID=124 RepID=A0A2S8F6F3_9BACT|nr:right-handed parallel beta-helix repeat-containing protein [Blastopirellula marina]PQO27735.1 pectate lyase [Blastopirellula marina]PTL41474.1 pectate lyase [Blastopirellula marina]
MRLSKSFALAIVWLSAFDIPAEAATYFVAVDGDDTHSGTIEQPFATLGRAQQEVAPGDTVYIRGGTYHVDASQIALRRRIWAHVFRLNKSGTIAAPIRYWAYENERPVFDFSAVKPEGLRVHAFSVSGSWLHLRGLEVIGVQVTMKGHTQSICFANDGSHNVFEQLSMHDGQAIGVYSVHGSDNLFLNCDAYNNYDSVSEGGRGGNVDGFGCHPSPGATGNVFRGCRAWFNSDDGFDCINAAETVRFENCWAFWNGYSPGFIRRADGNGFKAGGYAGTPASRLPRPIPRHEVVQCLAVRNKASGFYANHHIGGCGWLNNTGYRNGTNFNMLSRTEDNADDVPGYGHVLKNNLSFRGRDLANVNAEESVISHNSFVDQVDVSADDFLSLDEQQLIQPRPASGELPEIKLLHLAPESDCIDRGVPVGLPFQGTAPDLGAFETNASEK